MAKMKAIQVSAPGEEYKLVHVEIPEPKQNEVLIKVQACGICHGDTLVREGHYPGLTYPRIPGHEVVGIIEKLGSHSKYWEVGQRVGIGWHGGHCCYCKACRAGEFGSCENSLTTGLSFDGGYAEYMIGRMEVLTSIPEELTSVDAAPLLCAGRTTYGALKSSNLKGGDLVAIHGLGGLGHLAVQYARKLGLKVAVISRGKEKEALAKQLGTHHYFDSTAVNPAQELTKLGGAKAILCTAPNSKEMAELVNGLSRGGQMIIVTFTNEPMQLSPAILSRGNRSISGYTGGTPEEAVRFSLVSGVRPVVEVFPLEQAALAVEKMMTAKVHFRAVLKMEGD
ncbi:MAG: alcohol dehydrogenase catalytic domain-containing protein [Coprothermobacterota bacterium]|nr:alcohol dehydrogenase catalytic domain-containing protein [Coprothermobacterota bacterium]